MKFDMGWWWPDHEAHLLEWMRANASVINGRLAYQGKKQMAVLQHCAQRRKAIDIGAHVGLWSWNLSHVFEHVIAFEPVPEHCDCFTKNVMEHRDNVHLIDRALGAAPGRCTIVTSQGNSGDSRVHPDVTVGGTVQMNRLDEFALAEVDLIKIDAEGYEENILIGALDTVRQNRPVIIVEQKRDFATRFGLQSQGAVKLLQLWGYKQAAEMGGDFIMVPQ